MDSYPFNIMDNFYSYVTPWSLGLRLSILNLYMYEGPVVLEAIGCGHNSFKLVWRYQ
jgi:hypothetical protein